MNQGIMKILLKEILKIMKGAQSCLLDQFHSHKTDFIIKKAKKMNIILLYVPVGMTSLLQPLDVTINSIIKSHARKLWRMEQINDPYNESKLSDGVK